MDYVIPALIQKTISFKRLKSKNIKSYKVYTKTIDSNYASGIRTDLIDEIENPSIPSPYLKKITLPYSINNTWKLPDDIYMDKDHPFRVIVDGNQISSLYYTANKLTNLLTINSNTMMISSSTVIEIEYFQDIIVKSYMVEQDCEIIVEPVFQNTYNYGKHNIIV